MTKEQYEKLPVLWKGKLKDIWGTGPLMDAYTELNEAFRRGETDLTRYQDKIDEIVYGSKEKMLREREKGKKKIVLGKWYPHFRILDKLNPQLNGKNLYARLLIQKVFSYRFVKERGGDIYAEIDFNPLLFPQGYEGNERIYEFLREEAEGAEFVEE